MSKQLPPEILKIIEDRGYKLTEDFKMDNDVQTGYYHGFLAGHEAGATEWAGKAQESVLTLELINTWIDECMGHGKLLDADKAMQIIDAALAKYKEVSNG